MNFRISYGDFDADLLPLGTRTPRTPAFEAAARSYFEDAFRGVGGSVSVSFDDDGIAVSWDGLTDIATLRDRALADLASGDLPSAVRHLKAVTAREPDNAVAHYNLGMALSDLGETQQAALFLLRAHRLDEGNVNALVALGVALWRQGDGLSAIRRFRQALALDPDNGYAHRNLAAALGENKDVDNALRHFREAARILPDDPQTIFGLARALEVSGDDDNLSEADTLYTRLVDSSTSPDVAEMARTARSRIAQKVMRENAGGTRPDAVMYCLGALQRFATMTPEQVRQVAYEIAVKGQNGIEVNRPEITYTLNTLPGEFTGMQLMSYMYVSFKQVAPEADIGFDLAAEYNDALALFERSGN